MQQQVKATVIRLGCPFCRLSTPARGVPGIRCTDITCEHCGRTFAVSDHDIAVRYRGKLYADGAWWALDEPSVRAG